MPWHRPERHRRAVEIPGQIMQSIWLFILKMADHRDDRLSTKDNDIQPMVYILYFSARAREDVTRMAVLVTSSKTPQHPEYTAKAAKKARIAGIDLFVIGTCRDEPRQPVSLSAHNQWACNFSTGSLPS